MNQCVSPPLPKRQILIMACDKITIPRNGKRRSLVSDQEYIRKTIRSKTHMDRFLVYPMLSNSKPMKEGVNYLPIFHSCIEHNDRNLLCLVIECKFDINELYEDMTPRQYALYKGMNDFAMAIERSGGV